MPRKIRQLKAELRKAGFSEAKGRGKGSHTVWVHQNYAGAITLSGHDGDDADRYQERQVREAIEEAKGS